jgi:hypothetical protein
LILGPDWCWGLDVAQAGNINSSKRFFLEKRSKNFCQLMCTADQRKPSQTKVFCFFFSKKKFLPSLLP